MTEAVSRAPQEASRLSTTLHRAHCVWLENIHQSKDQHHAHLGAALASTQLPRGNQPSSPAPASPAPSTSMLRPAAPLPPTAPVPSASLAPREARARLVPREPSSLHRDLLLTARRALSTVSGRQRGVSRPTTVWRSPRHLSRRRALKCLCITLMSHNSNVVRRPSLGTT